MGFFTQEQGILVWQENQHKVWIQPWGQDGLRVRANLAGKLLEQPQALVDVAPPYGSQVEIQIEEAGASLGVPNHMISAGKEGATTASLRNGKIQALVARSGRIRFIHFKTGDALLEEPEGAYFAPPNRDFKRRDGRLYQIEAWFMAKDGERFYGLGQHQHGRLDHKGCVIDLQQRNTEVSIPFLVSNRGYGFLWNNPGLGRVELGMNATRWVANGSQQMDYYIVCAASYAEILERYADATGHALPLPEWASGFWQCKLRYETQEELLNVAREYKRRGLPLSVIVADFFHWSHMGDWRFDPACWPDPAAMTRELDGMGVKLMVSVWPTVSPISENYAEMKERGLLVNNERGVDAQHVFIDHGITGPAYFSYYDATNPEGRGYIWEKVKRGYYDHGVRLWWLDNDEPDTNPWHPENLRFQIGNGVEVANIYPLLHQMAFFDGMRSAGETEIAILSRSGWAGSQRYGAIIWSGDIASTFEALRVQVRAGLNMAMSGIPWWTTDIGGFHGGDIAGRSKRHDLVWEGRPDDIRTPYFQELIVRWFQYGVFCPIFRLHGYRQPERSPMPGSGADNEIWSFGERTYPILSRMIFLRERLRPYIHEHMQIAAEKGLPIMRPLFVDFQSDLACAGVEDQFMFGAEILVAPVLAEGARSRSVYLPLGADWVNAWTGKMLTGGQRLESPAPLETIPVFLRSGSRLASLFRE